MIYSTEKGYLTFLFLLFYVSLFRKPFKTPEIIQICVSNVYHVNVNLGIHFI